MRTVNYREIVRLQSLHVDVEARYIYGQLILWKSGSTLKGCFYDGTDKEKVALTITVQNIKNVSGMNLDIDFRDPINRQFRKCKQVGDGSHVRVTFTQGCCAAYVGRTAMLAENLNEPTMLLEGLDGEPGDVAEAKRIHEILHVVGFYHQHQAPNAPCEKDLKLDVLQQKTGWTDDEMKLNLAALNRDSASYKWSDYDASSIMKYYFPPDELSRGGSSACFSKDNLVLSKLDIQGLQDAYPSGARKEVTKARSLFNGILNSNASKELKALAKLSLSMNE